MERRKYFNKGFLLSMPIAVSIIVVRLFYIDYRSLSEILELFVIAIVSGIITGTILGLLNMVFKKDQIFKK
jgi:predicted RND superfamily exporter protein